MRQAMVVLLIGLLAVLLPTPVSSHHPSRLIWIPLDNRPVNTDEVTLFGEAAGLQVMLPPSERLDEDAGTADDFAKLLAWLRQASQPDDTQVLYTNRLLTGGLFSSRDVTVYADIDRRLTLLHDALKGLPPAPRIMVHILPRVLPPQFHADGSPNPDYDWRTLLVERSERINRLAQTDSPLDRARLAELERLIPVPAQERYNRLIRANEQIVAALLSWTREGLVSYLVVGLDDAGPLGMANLLHEQLLTRAAALGIADRVFRHFGADEIGFLVLVREALHSAGVRPPLEIQYDQNQAPAAVLPYEGSTLKESLEQKLAFLGAQPTPDATHQLFLHTVTAQQSPAAADRTVNRVEQARRSGHSVTVVDVTSPGVRDLDFLDRLRQAVPLAGLNYAGWNTASNALGTGLAMAALTELHQQVGATARQVLALETFRAVRLGYDCVYQSQKSALTRFAVQNGIDPDRFGGAAPAMERHLQRTVLPEVQSLLVDALGATLVEVEGRVYVLCVGRADLSFKLNRTFEIRLHPTLRLVEPYRAARDGGRLSGRNPTNFPVPFS